jgi:hypothetical protein
MLGRSLPAELQRTHGRSCGIEVALPYLAAYISTQWMFSSSGALDREPGVREVGLRNLAAPPRAFELPLSEFLKGIDGI